MQEKLTEIMNLAKLNLQNDGYLVPVAFLVQNNEISGILQLTYQDDKKKRLH